MWGQMVLKELDGIIYTQPCLVCKVQWVLSVVHLWSEEIEKQLFPGVSLLGDWDNTWILPQCLGFLPSLRLRLSKY